MIAWASAAALGALLAALEFRRGPRRHRALRMGAVLVAVASLSALAAPPSIPSPLSRDDTAILLTPGATPYQRRALRDSLPGARILEWPDSVASIDRLRLGMAGLRQLHVAGWGLREAHWEAHDDLGLIFHPAPPPPGFTSVTWPPVVRLGDDFTVVARLQGGSGDTPAWLRHPDGRVDTLPAAGGGESVARFPVRPRAEGPGTWVLGAGSAVVESLAVMVLPAQPPAVLVLEGAPSFETTFLRRWLAEQGATMAIRTRVSRDRYRTERINALGLVLDQVSPGLLARFDLVILDGQSLAALGPVGRSALDRAVRQDGLGVLVRPDTLARRAMDWFPFTLAPVGDLGERPVRPRWTGQAGGVRAPVPALGEEIVPGPRVIPLMYDPVGRIVAATARHGAGVVGTTLVTEPSRWLLDEEPEAFAGYWRALIAALARGPGERWLQASDGPVVVDHGVSLVLMTGDTLPLATVAAPDGTIDTLGLARDPAEPGRWWGRFWPRAQGWHHATNRDGEPYPFHVTGQRFGAREATARLAATGRQAGAAPTAIDPATAPGRRPLPPLLPFLALVGATGVLWGVERGGRGER